MPESELGVTARPALPIEDSLLNGAEWDKIGQLKLRR